MSYGVTPFAVSLPQLQKVVGSRSKSVLRELREEFEEELLEDREEVEEANEDDEFDPGLPLDDALRHLIMDEERWDYEGAQYGYAIEILCSFYGEFLPNDHWTGMDHDWAETVNDALQEIGVPSETFSILGHLLHRGSPVDIPEIDDFPFVGYVTLAEIPGALTALTDERFAVIEHQNADQIRISLKQIREWLETCHRDKSDLVCFYY
jgi:hypothetical protein